MTEIDQTDRPEREKNKTYRHTRRKDKPDGKTNSPTRHTNQTDRHTRHTQIRQTIGQTD